MRWRPLAGFALALLALVSAGAYADRTHRLVDLTTSNSLTLTDQTRGVLRGVHERIDVTAFIGRNEGGRAEASALLQRYHLINRKVRFRVIDPADAPALLQRLGIDPTVDVLAASLGSRVARAPTVTEADVTSVLAQVTRNVSATVCVATGHGEADARSDGDSGLAGAVRLLQLNGYKVAPVDLLTAPDVPGACTGLLLAAPTAPLGPAADGVARFLSGNGRAVVLTDPLSTADLEPVLAPYRLSVERGITVNPSSDGHLPDDPATVIVRAYSSTNPMVRRLPPTLFPAANAVVVGDLTGASAAGLSAVAVVQTGDDGYLETNPDHAGFTPGEDRRGPIAIAAAADLSRVAGPETIVRSRVAVFGDVDFATNKFIGTGGNGRLFLQ
ncbi:MAG: gliding motility-associatede transport system auxiliary component, partial [Actinomycetota bacterium]|nr:gliding motility-associatede transport system auxiliary component [Actinomycetota bacterium]